MTNDLPLVSIITPAYNAERYIAATAQSVLAQTYSHWEWIIVDDGSTDATATIISELRDSRILLIRSAHSGLPAIGRNVALQHATGAFAAFLDADDLWVADKLSAQMACFSRQAELGLVFSRFRYLHQHSMRLGRRLEPPMAAVPNPGMLFAELSFRNLIANSSAVVRRSMLDAHGWLDEDPRQRGTEDYELWLRLAPHAPFAWVDRPLLHYRMSSEGVSRSAVAIAKGAILSIEKALARDRRRPLHPELQGGRLEAWKLVWLGQAQLRDGVESCGRQSLLQSLRLLPFNRTAWFWLALSFLGPKINALLRRLAFRIL